MKYFAVQSSWEPPSQEETMRTDHTVYLYASPWAAPFFGEHAS